MRPETGADTIHVLSVSPNPGFGLRLGGGGVGRLGSPPPSLTSCSPSSSSWSGQAPGGSPCGGPGGVPKLAQLCVEQAGKRLDGSPAWSREGLEGGLSGKEIPDSAPLRLLPGLQDSPRCHEATVIFNLLRLLAWDLRLVAHSGPCL